MLVQFFVKITGRVNTSNDSIRQVAVSLLLSLVGAFSQLGNAKEELQFYNKKLISFPQIWHVKSQLPALCNIN